MYKLIDTVQHEVVCFYDHPEDAEADIRAWISFLAVGGDSLGRFSLEYHTTDPDKRDVRIVCAEGDGLRSWVDQWSTMAPVEPEVTP